jgi:hypothetical protein
MNFRLPSVLTNIMRLHPEVVRRRARSNRLKAFGNPYRFPVRQLTDLGINLEDAAADLADFASRRKGSLVSDGPTTPEEPPNQAP